MRIILLSNGILIVNLVELCNYAMFSKTLWYVMFTFMLHTNVVLAHGHPVDSDDTKPLFNPLFILFQQISRGKMLTTFLMNSLITFGFLL